MGAAKTNAHAIMYIIDADQLDSGPEMLFIFLQPQL